MLYQAQIYRLIQSFYMRLLTVIFILMLLLGNVMSLADIYREQVCSAGGKKTVNVVRQNPVRIAYTLLRGVDAGFPDLSDKFYVPKAQRVTFFYTITLTAATECAFYTTMVVDDKRVPEFNVMTSFTQERTHTAKYSVWLQAGLHYAYVGYFTNCLISNMPPNGEHKWWYSLLQIEYNEETA